MAANELSVTDQKDYEFHRKIIRANGPVFVQVGQSIAEINNRRLWRAEYESFDDFVKKELGISQRRAYQLMAGSRENDPNPPTTPQDPKPAVNADRGTARRPEPESVGGGTSPKGDPPKPPAKKNSRDFETARREAERKIGATIRSIDVLNKHHPDIASNVKCVERLEQVANILAVWGRG